MTAPPNPEATAQLDRTTLLALLDATTAINDARGPAAVFSAVAQQAAAVLNVEGASVLLYDAERQELVFETVVDPGSAGVVQGLRFPADEGIAGQVIKTRRAVRLDDARENRHFYEGVDQVSGTRTRGLMAAPLIHQDTVLGVVEVINRRDGSRFTPLDLELLGVFANLVAGAARRAQTVDRLTRENRGLREGLPPAHFIGSASAFEATLALCRKVAPTNTTVLLEGETGTGKEMAARAICGLSARADRPFVAINCAAMPATLIESELFGHEAGAFTGATERRAGRFELADGGTLLLDELGELELALQAKLLRVLETHEFTLVGGARPQRADVRIIAATNRDLRAEADAGRFRSDLYYRIGMFPIRLPPLRERQEDIPLLTEHLMAQVVPSLGVAMPAVSDDAMACLRAYAWPGNIRELRNVVERAVLLADGVIHPRDLPPEVAGVTPPPRAVATSGDSISASLLAEQEEQMVRRALVEHDWNQSAAARALGVSRDVLRARVRRYGLTRK
ncbi:MAG: sigma-54-dependent Fis family transcriptional regulator [Phycisphaerae bacterium]|nr:sigma-54-dependent Fis family transcriptional regulator [Phycisphaerae bacterium]NNF42246.1 sigma-54-dependent Fis family transcriptional regulator [Phycisphaerales bacterium]